EVVQAVVLAAVGVGRVGLAQAFALDATHAADRGDRHRELGFADAHEHRLGDRQRLRQAQGKGGALLRPGGDVERAAELAPPAGDHVHAHAAAGQAADFVGGGEARLEDERIEVAVAEDRALAQQAALHGAPPDRAAVQARAIVADLQHHFRTLAAYRDADRAFV